MVRDQILKIIRRVSPYAQGGVVITTDNLDSEEPEAFTKARILDAYNESRRILFQVLSSQLSERELELALKEIVDEEDVTVENQQLTKPTGFLRLIRAYNPVYSVSLEQLDLQKETIVHRNQKYEPSLTTQFIVDSGEKLRVYGPASGHSIQVRYYKLIDFTIANLSDSTEETYSATYHPALVSIAEAVLQGDGQVNPLSVAQLLAGGAG